MEVSQTQGSTMSRIPVAFKKSPLLEAIFEFRFQAAVSTAGDLLPGLLYAQLREEYPKVQALPMATVPRELRAKDSNLLYQATHELGGTARAVRVGDRVLTLSCTAPYPGWTQFKDAIVRLLRSAAATQTIAQPERFSFRYINLIPREPQRTSLSLLNLKIDSPMYTFVEDGFHLRFEHREGSFVTIVQVSPNVAAKTSAGALLSGLLVDLDTIKSDPGRTFWDEGQDLDEAHSKAKAAFISMLAPSTIEQLEPIY